MQPTFSTPTDAIETQKAFRALAVQIEQAVAQDDTETLQQLSHSRHLLLRNACGSNGSVHFPDSLRAELIRENETLITLLLAYQQRIAGAIKKLRSRHNTRNSLPGAYRAATSSTVAQCVTRRG